MTLLEERPDQALTSVRVVLVDDTPSLRMLTRLTLDGTGFDVVGEAGDGQAGVELVTDLQPDLVLLDLAMPVMDGLEAMPLMRAAALRNTDLTDFVLQPALREAKAVIEEAERIVLSERDSLMVLNLLENPPAPNAKLRAAIRAMPKPTQKRV